MLAWYGEEPEQREALAIYERLGARPARRRCARKCAIGVSAIFRAAREHRPGSNPFGLTRREAEILGLLSEGLRNSVIAKRLFLSTKTVERHVSAILAKLDVRSRAEAVAVARSQQAGDGEG